MKVTTGYVAVKEDGTFLQVSLQNRWGIETVSVSETNDIETATIFAHPTIRALIKHHKLEYEHKFSFVPVEIRREVVQTGWGVQQM